MKSESTVKLFQKGEAPCEVGGKRYGMSMKLRLCCCLVAMISWSLLPEVYASTPAGETADELVNHNYKLTFYGADKKPQDADYQRALLRWSPKNKSGQERYMLTLDSDGKSLVSPRYVRPPHNYRLIITLISDDSETESETHVVWFRL